MLRKTIKANYFVKWYDFVDFWSILTDKWSVLGDFWFSKSCSSVVCPAPSNGNLLLLPCNLVMGLKRREVVALFLGEEELDYH